MLRSAKIGVMSDQKSVEKDIERIHFKYAVQSLIFDASLSLSIHYGLSIGKSTHNTYFLGSPGNLNFSPRPP